MKYNRFMGEYDDNTIYQAGDVVNFDGASYYRKVPGKGISPIARKKPYTVWSRLSEALSTIFPLGGTGGGGASLPAAAPYQQLVTDGEGNWGVEDRLAWKETVTKNETVEFLGGEGEEIETRYIPNLYYAETAKFKIDDGPEYICKKQSSPEVPEVFFGNMSLLGEGESNTGEPFVFAFTADEGFVFGKVSDEIPFESHSLNIEYVGSTITKVQTAFLPEATKSEKGIMSFYDIATGFFPEPILLAIGVTTYNQINDLAWLRGQTCVVTYKNVNYYVYHVSSYAFNGTYYYALHAIDMEGKALRTISGTFNGEDADSTVATVELS